VYVMTVEYDSFLRCGGNVAGDVKVHQVAVERDVIVAKIILRRRRHKYALEE
jgi:hypothetical protein